MRENRISGRETGRFIALMLVISILPFAFIEVQEGSRSRIGRHDLTIWSVQVDPAVIGPGVLEYPDSYDADKYKDQQTTMDVSDEVPNEGDIVLINLTVFNIGLEEGSAEVEFFDGPRETGTFIGNDTVDVKALNHDIASSSWDTAGVIGEEHEIFAYIIPDDPENETNSDNNQGSRSIIVNFYPIVEIDGFFVDDVFGAEIEEGDRVLFDGGSSTDTQRDLDAGLSFKWDFNDPWSDRSNPEVVTGNNLTRVEHIFGDAGSYPVSLTVTDQHGASMTDTLEINVMKRVPEAGFLPEGRLFREDEIISFDASPTLDSEHDLELMQYMWDLGDGTVTEWSGDHVLEHSYPDAGKYTVQLWARDDEGAVGNAIREYEVINVEPGSWIERVEVNGKEVLMVDGTIDIVEDDTVRLESGASDTASDIDTLEVVWRTPEGGNLEQRNLTLSFGTSGKRDYSLIVTDDDGGSSVTDVEILVSNLPPIADAGEGGTFTTSNVRFDGGGSHDTPSDLEKLEYEWDLGDGNGKTGRTVYHTYEDRGTYDVTLKVTDDDGEFALDRIRITIENLAPQAMVEGPGRVVEDEVFMLDAGGSSDMDGEIRSFRWIFPDGEEREGVRTRVSFHRSGEYDVMLAVTDNDGASSKVFWTVLVENIGPVADAGPDNETVIGEKVILDAGRSNDTASDLRNLTYEWTLPNGSVKSGKVIEVLMDAPGSHIILLRVTDPEGLISVDEIIIRVLSSALENIIIDLYVEPGRCLPGDILIVSGKVTYEFKRPLVEQETGLVMANIHIGEEVHRVLPDRTGRFEMTATAPVKTGEYDIRCTITRLGMSEESTVRLIVEREEDQSTIVTFARSPAGIASGAALIIAGGGFAAAMSTDIGRWKFFILLIPLFSRIKRDEVLDNFERGRIYQYILLNPGDYFSHIREMLGLNSGTLTYHLKVLEQREFIRSRTDGNLKRFYPYDMRIEEGGHRDIQSLILELLAFNPGLSQKEIARSLGVHVSTVNYHINMMVGAGLLRSDRSRRTQRYEVQYIAQEIPVE
ncbi:MAG: PKD domain-containing protein [Thermoplasmatota archaeon]